MVELFTDLPEEIKKKDELIIDYIITNFMPYQHFNFITNFINTCSDKEEQDFIKFYYSLCLERLMNESNND